MQEEYFLHGAVKQQKLKAVTFLLSKGCDPNQPNPNDNGQTPMHHAAAHYDPFVFHALISNRGNPRVKDNGGLTPVDMFLLYPPENPEHRKDLLHYFQKKCPELLIEKENQLESLQIETGRHFKK